MSNNLMVAQSGGPTSVINSTLCGIIKESVRLPKVDNVYGALHGILGILDGNIIRLDNQFATAEDFFALQCTPSSALGSCRFKMPKLEDNRDTYKKIHEIFKKLEIKYFLYIGGNDSMDTANKMAKYFAEVGEDIKVIGVPKTIDNDLAATDHCPGFGSAAKFIATVTQEIIRDAVVYPVKSATVIEIMGRNAGWLTAASMIPKALGGVSPDLVYLPETPFNTEEFIKDVNKVFENKNNVVVAVSEGVKLANGEYVASEMQSGEVDAFGHKYLAGVGKYLERLISAKVGCKVRSAELNVMQRAASHIVSATDMAEAEAVGAQAVKEVTNGKTGVMLAFERISSHPYVVDIRTADVNEIANKEKKFPENWIVDKNTLSKEAQDYMLPLVVGEVVPPCKNGIPMHFAFNKTDLVKL